MAGDLTREILARTQRPSRIRYGNVEAVGGGLASVRMGSAVVDNATWCRRYAPIVGDRVAVLASGSGWLILDAVERVQRAYNEPETVLVRPSHGGRVQKPLWSSSWDDDPLAPGPHPSPKLPEPLDMDWTELNVFTLSHTSHHFAQAGYYYALAGGEWINYVPSNGYGAEFLWYPQLSTQVPSNSVIQSASLVLRLWEPSPSTKDPFLPPPNMPVKIHAHAQPAADSASGGQPPEAYMSSAHSAIDVGDAYAGDLIMAPLGEEVVDDLASGALKGLALWPGETQKRVAFEDLGTWSWTKPYPNSPGYYQKTYTTNDCFSLQITYITPVEED